MATEVKSEEFQIFTLEECQEVVKKSLKLPSDENIKIISYKVTKGSDDLVGFMGEYFKLKIIIEDKNTAGSRHLNYFVKALPITNEYHRKECIRKGFFSKETAIYREILTNIQKYAPSKLFPECYLSRYDVLVLEDLFNTPQGFRHLISNETYTLQHHHVMLRHLARLHAGSLAWELKEGVNIGERFKEVLFEMQLTVKNEWYITGVKSIIYLALMHPKYQTPKLQSFIRDKLFQILCDTEELTAPSKEFCNVFCHRDSWDRNIFYSFNATAQPIDCCIVDFQLSRYSPPGLDVLFFLYMTTNRRERDGIYNHCLDFYHEALVEALRDKQLSEQLITKEEFLRGCKRSRLAVLIVSAICEPLVKMPNGLANKWRSEEQEKFDYYMNSKRDELFERIFAVDEDYKNIVMAPVEELLDYLLDLYGVDGI